MKTKNEKSLKMAVKVIQATKGNGNSSELLKQIFHEINKLKGVKD